MNIVKKLTIKTCGNFTQQRIRDVLQEKAGFAMVEKDGATVREPKPMDDGLTVDLLRITGSCRSAKTGSTDKGDYVKLGGDFIGVDLTTGEVYQSEACILPQFVGAIVGSVVLSANGAPVEFGFCITAQRVANSVTGYSFGVRTLLEPARNDTQTRLLALAKGETPPALAAPSANPEPTPAVNSSEGGQTVDTDTDNGTVTKPAKAAKK